MIEKHYIVTTMRWDSWFQKLELIRQIKSLTKGINKVEFVIIENSKLIPKVINGRIDHGWFEDNLSKQAKIEGCTHAKFVFSDKQGRQWKLESGVNGSNLRDGDFFGESWIKSDENDISKFDDGGTLPKFVRVFIHEDNHEYVNQGFTDLQIHDYDYNTLQKFLEYQQKVVITDPEIRRTLYFRITNLLALAGELIAKRIYGNSKNI